MKFTVSLQVLVDGDNESVARLLGVALAQKINDESYAEDARITCISEGDVDEIMGTRFARKFTDTRIPKPKPVLRLLRSTVGTAPGELGSTNPKE